MIILFIVISLFQSCSAQLQCPTNCLRCISFNVCQECLPSYNLFTNNTCIMSPPRLGCQLYTLSNTCARCLHSYMIFSGQCYPPIISCLSYASAGRCKKCINNYLLFEGECFEQGKSSCPQGLVLYNNSCLQIQIVNCLEFNQGICVRCSLQYSLLNGICVMLRSTPNCQTYSNNICTSCIPGEYLLNGTCGTIFLDNCQQRNGFVCEVCNGTNYVLFKGVCRRRQIQSDPFCVNKDQQTNKCVRCTSDYYLNSHRVCIKINSSCLTNNSAGNCATCGFPLTLLNNTCVYSDPNCLEPNFQTQTCRRCKPGYQLETNGLTCKTIQPCLKNFSDNNGCMECSKGYLLIDATCRLLPANCLSLNRNGSSCILCSNDTVSFNDICVYANPYCLVYQRQTGYCIKCGSGYTTSGKSCIPLPFSCSSVNKKYQCLSCKIGYELRKGICIKTITHCLFYNNQNCIQCQWYYYVSQSGQSCEQYPSLCNMVDNSGLCISCQEGLTLFFGKCIFYQTLCIEYSDQQGTSGNCIKAQKTFFLSNNYVIGSKTVDYWDSKGNILACKGMLTIKNSVCAHLIIGCSSYDQLSNCKECSRGFALILNQCILDTNICLSRKDNECLQCIGGFLAYNGTCFSYQNNADQWDISGKPIKPSDGYIITSLGITYSLPFNCLNYDIITGLCIRCENRFTVLNGKCVILVPFCIDYNQRGICQNCSGDYRMIFGMCRNVSMCDSFNENQCTSCIEGARLMSGICITNFKELSCLEFNNNFVCLKCRNGYYLMKQKCYAMPINCQTVDLLTGVCINCLWGFRLQNSSCLPTLSNCQQYNQTTGICSACSSGYVLLKNYTCHLLPPLCQAINQNSLICISCLSTDNFLVPNQNRCSKIIPNCLKFYSDGHCAQCQSNYSLIKGQCLSGLICSDTTLRVFNNSCVRKILNCVKYTAFRCNTCQKGYYLDYNYNCQINPIGCQNYILPLGCTKCTLNYILQDKICINSIPQTNSQDNCILLINNTCQKCSNNYILVQNKCLISSPNCIIYSKSGICLSCQKGYYLNKDKKCTSLQKNCLECNPFGICLICSLNYFLIQNVCLLNVNNCIAFDMQSGLCSKCSQNMTLINGSFCILPSNNCNSFSIEGKCTKCNQEYTLINDSCIKIIQKCNRYYSNNGSCAGCIPTHYLTSLNYCFELPLNCIQADPKGQCTKCNNQSVLYQSKCIKSVSYCKSYNPLTFDCLECITNYKLVNNICISIVANCLIVSSIGTCLFCNDGYTLTGDNCIQNTKQSNNVVFVQNSIWPNNIILNSNCPDNYYLVQGHCYKNISFTYPVSTISSVITVYSSISRLIQLPCVPRIGSINWWQSNRNAPEQWVGYSFPTTLRIQSIQIQGNGVNSWVSKLMLKYKTSPTSSTFECFNNCESMTGSQGLNDILTLSFQNPIITKQLRIYPQEWTGQIAMRFEFLSD